MTQQVDYLGPVAAQSVESRSTFIWRCYAHVVGGILAFAAASAYLYDAGVSERLLMALSGRWLLALGAFMLVSWGATHVAHTVKSTPAQYGAYAVLVVAEAVIFAPMLYLATIKAPGVIESAAGVTVLGAGGLIAVAMMTRKDFSFLRGMLFWGGILALVAIVSSFAFGFHLGTWFSVAMIGFAGAAVLYDTSNIMQHYPEDRYVAASMALFASIALMFWYILQFFMGRD